MRFLLLPTALLACFSVVVVAQPPPPTIPVPAPDPAKQAPPLQPPPPPPPPPAVVVADTPPPPPPPPQVAVPAPPPPPEVLAPPPPPPPPAVAAPPKPKPSINSGPLTPFACHPSSYRCAQDAIWGCEGSHHQRIVTCANLSCKHGHCTWLRDRGMEGTGKGAMLVVDIERCCDMERFILDVPESADLGGLAWERSAAGA